MYEVSKKGLLMYMGSFSMKIKGIGEWNRDSPTGFSQMRPSVLAVQGLALRPDT